MFSMFHEGTSQIACSWAVMDRLLTPQSPVLFGGVLSIDFLYWVRGIFRGAKCSHGIQTRACLSSANDNDIDQNDDSTCGCRLLTNGRQGGKSESNLAVQGNDQVVSANVG